MAPNLSSQLHLLLIADQGLFRGRDPVALAKAAVAGGVTAVQLRWKEGPVRDQVALARRLREALAVPVFINDRPDVALAAGCAGVHLGADDLPLLLARRLGPPGFLIGASVGDLAEAGKAAGADYAGIGPWRETGTKTDAGSALGRAEVGRLIAAMAKAPSVVIGGVRPEDVPAILELGAAGSAVGAGILGYDDVTRAAAAYREAERGLS